MGESTKPPLKVRFDRRVHLEFHGTTITSDAGLLACRELDDALGLTETATACLQESRGGDSGAVEFQVHSPVESHFQGRFGAFTHWVPPMAFRVTCSSCAI